MKKISASILALLILFACAAFVSCANIYTLGLDEVTWSQILSNASGDYTLKTLAITYNSSGVKTGETSSNDGSRSALQLKAEATLFQALTGAKAYANSSYSKIVLYKKVTDDNSGNLKSEIWYQYTR